MSVLPPAVLQARAVLAERGPLDPVELQQTLRQRGIVVNLELLHQFGDRFGDHFAVDTSGRLALPEQVAEVSGHRHQARDDEHAWWIEPAPHDSLELDDLVVLDIETTGLDREQDHVWQLAAVRLDGSPDLVLEIDHDGRTHDPRGRDLVSLSVALDRLEAYLDGATAIGGHRVGAFDVPFLRAAASRVGRAFDIDLPTVDVHLLSLLVEPCLAGRTLSELCDHFGVDLDEAHQADSDARATAQLIRRLLDAVDPDDPGWRLAMRLLAEAGEPIVRLLSVPPPDVDLADALVPRPDPLAGSASGQQHELPALAGLAVHSVFDRLAEEESYRRRPQQLEMADAVIDAFEHHGRLAVEAPTGTGKSLAYLVPAAVRARRRPTRPVVVATHTKLLQQQLRRDAERLRHLGLLPVPFRQVFGIANYVCTREIAAAIQERQLVGSEWTALAVAVRALAASPNGVWDDVTDWLVRRSDIRYRQRRESLTATTNSCQRRQCEHAARCPLFVRLAGVDAQPGILAVNHALVASWSEATLEGGRAPASPFGDDNGATGGAFVFDEAHTLEDSLTSAWTKTVGGVSLHALVGRLWGRFGPVRQLERAIGPRPAQPDAFRELPNLRREIDAGLIRLHAEVAAYVKEYGGVERLTQLTPAVRVRSEFRSLANAAHVVAAALARCRKALLSAVDGVEDHRTKSSAFAHAKDIEEFVCVLDALRDIDRPHQFVHLLSVEPPDGTDIDAERLWTYQQIPVDVGERFRSEIIDRADSVVLTSATLTVSGGFDFLGRRLGIQIGNGLPGSFDTRRLDSPFDHERQSAVVLTDHLPVPVPAAEREFCEDLARDHVGFLSLSGGRALTLFAARRRMQRVAELVRERKDALAERGVELLVQGEDSIARLTNRFRTRPGTALFGLRSFWQGFDAPGDTLQYLFIEKPPYPHPGDPVHTARQRAVQDAGGDPFLDYVVPLTALTLAQGFGRLIRTEDDRGVAIVCDPRVQNPTIANAKLLETLPTRNVHYADGRDDAWTYALRFVTGEEPDLASALDLPLDQLTAALEEFRLVAGEDPVPKLSAAASLLFGITRLRDEQVALMQAILDGRDCLGFLPTGSGKSLCFQLPALLHPEGRPTVVVSPLVALIKDQVDVLRAQRGLRMVRGITGRTTAAERDEALRDLADGRVRLLYVSPERLVRDGTLAEALARCALGALVVDEAHCVSSWGHDFRPEFRQVVKPALNLERCPRVGLTATATPEVEDDLVRTLKLDEPVVVRTPVDRPDLRYSVLQLHDERSRMRELLRFVTFQGDRAGIIYASTRATTEELAWLLRQVNVPARAYHAGLLPEQRESVQEDFLEGTTQIVVATKAFGMGINKPDIAWVLHFDLPESLEAYVQESGRAARAPEMTGDCVLLFTRGDIARRWRQAKSSPLGRADLAQQVLDALVASPTRGDYRIVDPNQIAEELGVEADDLNVLVSWLEGIGAVERRQDATVRGTLSVGRREPADKAEQRQFFRIVKETLRCRIGVQRRVVLDEAARDVGLDPDELERLLVDWSLRRFATFRSTVRHWRVDVRKTRVDTVAFDRLVRRWQQLEQRRVQQIIEYATGSTCRRVAIAKAFGDDQRPCHDSEQACDVCHGDLPAWHAVSLQRVPDPETVVDVDLIVLQAVRWANRSRDAGHDARYGEATIKAAILGEGVGGGPISPALLRCPQFGALRYLRGARRRVDEAVEGLINANMIERQHVTYRDRRYTTLLITDDGRRALGGSYA